MNKKQIKIFADSRQAQIDEFSAKAKMLKLPELNDAMTLLIEKHRPLHEERVRTAMEQMILAREIRLRLLKNAFPSAGIIEVNELCKLEPSDHVLGDTEAWIERLKAGNLSPSKIEVDKTRMTIRLLE
jgi:hypothetical protein